MLVLTCTNFYPRPPRGGRPPLLPVRDVQPDISIHALREEGDDPDWCGKDHCLLFLSTPSARRATTPIMWSFKEDAFLSTPSARRATMPLRKCRGRCDISIHALREEGDLRACTAGLRQPRRFLSTPSARRATTELSPIETTSGFLSTPSARRATCFPRCAFIVLLLFLSTPSARRATIHTFRPDDDDDISIHALREEGD